MLDKIDSFTNRLPIVYQMFNLIVAFSVPNQGIGRNGKLPWKLDPDLKRFKELTMGGVVIMGRRTWESIGRPLKGRMNIVLTSQPEQVKGADQVCGSFAEALRYASGHKIFVIGGEHVYAEAIRHSECVNIYATEVLHEVKCDTFFPEIPAYFNRQIESEVQESNGLQYQYVLYTNNNNQQ
jgi:dihydrofolate reductase